MLAILVLLTESPMIRLTLVKTPQDDRRRHETMRAATLSAMTGRVKGCMPESTWKAE